MGAAVFGGTTDYIVYNIKSALIKSLYFILIFVFHGQISEFTNNTCDSLARDISVTKYVATKYVPFI